MNTDVVLRCDECGKDMVKAHRNYKGQRYCNTCYVREFKPRECSRCGTVARLLRSLKLAICQTCEKAQPCIRCGKTTYSIGKVTEYGPACNACSVYFRQPEPCAICGRLSQRLTRSSELGHDLRVCPRCVTARHGSCRACHRYRKLWLGNDGLQVCQKCHEQGEVTCPECLESMPAGYGSRCESCYWRSVLQKRIQMDCTAFSSRMMAEHFKAFGYWLLGHAGPSKAALTIHQYLVFFCIIEKQWGDVPDYSELLRHFSVAKLRRSLLPMRWMEHAGLVFPDEVAKAEDSERRRIIAIQKKLVPGTCGEKLLDSYLEALLRRHEDGKMTLRSVRLALTPAAALLNYSLAFDNTKKLPLQKDLNEYLSSKPGQKAAVHGFVRYLREKCGAEIEIPNGNHARELNLSYKVLNLSRKRLEVELLALMRLETGCKDSKARWLATALPYFHALKPGMVKEIMKTGFSVTEDGVAFTWKGMEYWLPVPHWWDCV